ncbi:ABC transporter ATP-binding protein [Thermopirellula anaerolimosa]
MNRTIAARREPHSPSNAAGPCDDGTATQALSQGAAAPMSAASTDDHGIPPTDSLPVGGPRSTPPAPHLRWDDRDSLSHNPLDDPKPASTASEPQLCTTGLTKAYRKAAVEIPVLRGVDLEVHRGEFLAIVGQSGSGKSTLLHLLGLLDRPDDGSIRLAGSRIDDLPPTKRDHFRNRCFGMVFQFYHLLPELTALENVMVPGLIATNPLTGFRRRPQLRRRATELLELMGLSHRLRHRPREMSGGEMQRTAIARALMNRPQILLADEPTGNLDQGTGREILKTLRTLNGIENLTIVMVTHDPTIAAQADRVVRLREGRVVPA